MEKEPQEEKKEHTHCFIFDYTNTEYDRDEIYVWAYSVCQTCGKVVRTRLN